MIIVDSTTISLEWKGTVAVLRVQGSSVGNEVQLTLAQLDELLSEGEQAARNGRAVQRPGQTAAVRPAQLSNEQRETVSAPQPPPRRRTP